MAFFWDTRAKLVIRQNVHNVTLKLLNLFEHDVTLICPFSDHEAHAAPPSGPDVGGVVAGLHEGLLLLLHRDGGVQREDLSASVRKILTRSLTRIICAVGFAKT